MPKLKKEKHISRLHKDISGFDGFWLRFHRGTNADTKPKKRQQLELSKCFSKRDYGTLTAALAAAVSVRDEFLETRDKTNKNKAMAYSTPPSHNTSGVTGVHRRKYPIDSDGKQRKSAWVATWHETTECGNRKQCVKHFGYDEDDFEGENIAFKHAVRLRKRMVKQHYKGTRRISTRA